MVLIGDCTAEQDHTIALLKSGTLVQDIWSDAGSKVELGIPALLRAIDRLNVRAENRLLQAFPGISVKACTSKEIKEIGVNPYCEDGRLSLKFPGTYYKSISIPSNTPTISDAARQELLDTLVCFFNLDDCKPKSNNELMNAWRTARKVQEEQQQQIFFTEAELQAREEAPSASSL